MFIENSQSKTRERIGKDKSIIQKKAYQLTHMISLSFSERLKFFGIHNQNIF